MTILGLGLGFLDTAAVSIDGKIVAVVALTLVLKETRSPAVANALPVIYSHVVA